MIHLINDDRKIESHVGIDGNDFNRSRLVRSSCIHRSPATLADSDTLDSEFTTLTTVPGTMTVHGAAVQILDLPGIIEGAKDGKGRGRQVIAGSSYFTTFLGNVTDSHGGYSGENV